MNNFYLLTFIILLISFLLSIIDMLDKNNTDKLYGDFKPNTSDKTITRKFFWYFSQITYQSQILLLVYFGIKLFSKTNMDFMFKIIAPISLTVTIQYLLLLYPKRKPVNNKKGIHTFSFISFVPHILNFFIIFIELNNIKTYHLNETFLYLFYCVFILLSVYVNYIIRKVWTYNLLDLTKVKGKKLFGYSIIILQVSSFILYYLHKLKIKYKI